MNSHSINISPVWLFIFTVSFQYINITTALSSQDNRIHLYDVQNYDITIQLDAENKTFRGRIVVEARSLKNFYAFVLSAIKSTLTIDSVFFESKKASFTQSSDYLIAHPADTIQAGQLFYATIFYRGISTFSGEYDKGGIYFNTAF